MPGDREPSLRLGLIDQQAWAEGIADLKGATLDGTFCYTFFKATAHLG